MDYQVSKKIRGISWLPKEKLAARKRTLPHEFGYFLIRCISARQFRSIIPLEPGPLQRSVTFRFSYQRSSHHLPLLCFPVQQRSSAASSTSSQFLNQDTHTHTHTHTHIHSWEASGPAAVGQSDSSGTGENHTNSWGICPMWYTVLFPPTLKSRTTAAASKAGQVVRDSWLNSLLTPHFAWDRQAFASAFVMLICVTLAV